MRNTLNALDLQLLLLESSDPEVQRQIVESRQLIAAEARRLARLSQQFQKPNPQWIEYSMADLMQDVMPRMQKRLGTSMARVEWVESAPDTFVRIDFEMFSELLGELLVNAIEHGHEQGSIRVSASLEDEMAVLHIMETMSTPESDPSEWGKAPFYARPNGGYGVGLYYSRQLAQAMDMHLDFHFQPENALLTTSLALPIVGAR